MPDSSLRPPSFTATMVTDAAARSLLATYFAERAQSFPAEQGDYSPAFPAAEQFVPPRGVFLLLGDSESDRFVGCGGIRRLNDIPPGTVRYEIKHLWLHPKTRRRGWGRALLAELEQRARDLGATETVLDTHWSLTVAGALYVSAGYDEIAPYNSNPNATTWYAKPMR
jgi:ribosomal protein S18 acetylase RimI-like enzyme